MLMLPARLIIERAVLPGVAGSFLGVCQWEYDK